MPHPATAPSVTSRLKNIAISGFRAVFPPPLEFSPPNEGEAMGDPLLGGLPAQSKAMIEPTLNDESLHPPLPAHVNAVHLRNTQAASLLTQNPGEQERNETADSAHIDLDALYEPINVNRALMCIDELGVKNSLLSLLPLARNLRSMGLVFVARDDVREKAFITLGCAPLLCRSSHNELSSISPMATDPQALEALLLKAHDLGRGSLLGRLRACGLMLYAHSKTLDAILRLQSEAVNEDARIIAYILGSYAQLTNRVLQRQGDLKTAD